MIEKIKQIQRILGVIDDGIWGPKTQAALDRAIGHDQTIDISGTGWHEGLGSSFADPADIRAFKRCKAQGKSDQECFKVGDNGIGKWGADTTTPVPMCALPREDWAHLAKPAGTIVLVEHDGQVVRTELQDTMPARANIKNGAIIDLNQAAWRKLGKTPPVLTQVRWRWA
jgi:peptidoglycan hydrolase-like protein with peptidoglycan-binding domain